MERQVKLNRKVGTINLCVWMIVLVMLVGCMPEDCIRPTERSENMKSRLNRKKLLDKEYHGIHTYWEESMPGHDFSKTGTVTLYFLESSPSIREVKDVFLISKDRGKESQFRMPGMGKDRVSEYRTSMIPYTHQEGLPSIQISLVSGPGEKYDEILALVRN